MGLKNNATHTQSHRVRIGNGRVSFVTALSTRKRGFGRGLHTHIHAELHRPLIKSTKLLLKVIQAIIVFTHTLTHRLSLSHTNTRTHAHTQTQKHKHTTHTHTYKVLVLKGKGGCWKESLEGGKEFSFQDKILLLTCQDKILLLTFKICRYEMCESHRKTQSHCG